MKIAKKIIDTQQPDETYNSFIARVAYPVKDDYDFINNAADDITSIANSNILFSVTIIDTVLHKDVLKGFLPLWNSLSFDDKKYLVRFYVYPPAEDLLQYYTEDELKMYWSELAALTKTARKQRWEAARLKVSYYLTALESLQFYNDTKAYKGDYEDANIPYLTLWLSNGSYPALGIDFITNGFAQKSYYSIDKKNMLLDILNYGLY